MGDQNKIRKIMSLSCSTRPFGPEKVAGCSDETMDCKNFLLKGSYSVCEGS